MARTERPTTERDGSATQEQTWRVERAKWDALAPKRLSPEDAAPPVPDFGAYARQSISMTGIADFLGDLAGRQVLDYGCGRGITATLLAKSGARVSAFDLSPAMVQATRERAHLNGVEIEVTVAAGENLPYDDSAFDVVFGRAILHHLAQARAGPELHRVLRPDGRVAFSEPLGTNPVLAFVRDHVPYRAKNPRGADRPLTYRDLEAWGRGFRRYEYTEVELLSMLERAFGHHQRFPRLRRVDERLLARIPALRRLCRYVTLRMVK